MTSVGGQTPASTTRVGREGKSAQAFRTISEVAGDLDVAQHVLRFWESKFSQVRPLKRGGGRRYYRPEDVAILQQIRTLLYDKGYTIKGAQKLLKSSKGDVSGVAHADSISEEAVSVEAKAKLTRMRDNLVEMRKRLQAAR